MVQILDVGAEQEDRQQIHSIAVAVARKRKGAHEFLHHALATAEVDHPGDALLHHQLEFLAHPGLVVVHLLRARHAGPIEDRVAVSVVRRIQRGQGARAQVAVERLHPTACEAGTLDDEVHEGAAAETATAETDHAHGTADGCRRNAGSRGRRCDHGLFGRRRNVGVGHRLGDCGRICPVRLTRV